MASSYEELRELAEKRMAFNARMKGLLVSALELDFDPDLIGDDQPLFGRGLGLDSLDTLEIVVMLDEHFGVAVSDDTKELFGSVNKIADYVIGELGSIPVGAPA